MSLWITQFFTEPILSKTIGKKINFGIAGYEIARI